MHFSKESSSCNPHDLSLHKQVKEITDLLRPELSRLHKAPKEASGDAKLYTLLAEQITLVKKEVTNHKTIISDKTRVPKGKQKQNRTGKK